VVAADFRYHGLSSDEGEMSLEANAGDVESIIDALGLENPAIAGHSLGGMVAAVYATRHPDCPGVANLDGHGKGTPDQYVGITSEQLETFEKQMEQWQNEQTSYVTSGDDAWHDEVVAQAMTETAARGDPPSVAEEWLLRSLVRDEDGRWNLRPSPQLDTVLRPMLDSLRMFDVYRAVECPLVIYNCTRNFEMPVPGAEEVMSAYRRGLARDLEALAAEHPNVRVRTVDATHGMIFEIPEEVARDILSLTP
jgi:pimeloyl-ACP methyl ester carboxylesterase